jgi:hypothetical protein
MASRLPDDHRANKKQNYWKQPFPKYFEPVNVYEGVIMNGIGGGLLGTIYATFQVRNDLFLIALCWAAQGQIMRLGSRRERAGEGTKGGRGEGAQKERE